MTTEQFLVEFAEVVAADAGSLRSDTRLSSLEGWDSVAYLSTMVLLDEKLGVTVPHETLLEAKTVADLIRAADGKIRD